MARPTKDISGQKFGLLTAISVATEKLDGGSAYWNCSCECGGTKISRARDLENGRDGKGGVTSCGCKKRGRISNKAAKEIMIEHQVPDGKAVAPAYFTTVRMPPKTKNFTPFEIGFLEAKKYSIGK